MYAGFLVPLSCCYESSHMKRQEVTVLIRELYDCVSFGI